MAAQYFGRNGLFPDNIPEVFQDQFNIYHNRKLEIKTNDKEVVVLGHSKMNLETETTSTIIVLDNSEVVITARNFAVIQVILYHNAKVWIDSNDWSKIFVENYSKKSKIDFREFQKGKVIINNLSAIFKVNLEKNNF